MKNIIKIFYSIMMIGILVSTMILTSFSSADEILLNAEEITAKLLSVGLNEDESVGYINTSYIKGLNEETDYILAECETGGYAIFEKDTYELIEYSPIGQSPYHAINKSESYYAGPVNYFKKSNDGFENLNTKETISKTEGALIASNIRIS